MKSSRTALWIALSLVLAPGPSRAEIVERVVVVVNGEILTLSEFASRQVAAVQRDRIPPEQVEEYLRRNNARILQGAIEELLLVQRAAEIGIELKDAYVDRIIEDIKEENGITTEEQFRRQLAAEGMTLDDMRRNISRSVLSREVMSQELRPRMTVTAADVVEEYEENKTTRYTVPASVTLEEIVVEDGPTAASIVARARAGEKFGDLARSFSLAPSSDFDGQLGRVALADLSPAVTQAVESLDPGEVSEPLKLGDEYRILHLVERSDSYVTPFDEVREELTRALEDKRMAEEYDTYVKDLQSQAVIDVRVREVPVAVDAEGRLVAAPELDEPAADSLSEFEGLDAEPGSGPERVTPTELPEE